VKESYKEFFKGKNITQMGLGVLGRGVGDAEFLAECGAKLLITDLKLKEQLSVSLERLKKFENIKFILGEHRLEDFSGRGEWKPDFVLKSAGVPLDSPFILEAKKNNIPVEMDASLFCKLLPDGVTTIGITGTRGKSTTTHLIFHILNLAVNNGFGRNQNKNLIGQKTEQPSVFLAGNVRDMATLPLIKEVSSGDYVVLELDSWQLQGFGDSKISPNISVFTTFMEDHMNYYNVSPKAPNALGQAMENYFSDKANIFKYQKDGLNHQNKFVIGREDVFVIGEGMEESFKKYGKGLEVSKNTITAKKADVPFGWKVNLLGEHNLLNISCAIAVARALKIDEEIIKKAVESFKPVSGRLEFLREVNGVKIYNDNNATTPVATLKAIEALKNIGKNLILISGGADKGLELEELVGEINKSCKAVVLLPGTGTSRLISNYQLSIINQLSNDLNDAIKKAMHMANEGDVVLFSPGFASFGMFVNEYDRNDQFVKIISQI
jgi:UDP-N-acetylmuramoylalanine--D-glutamate ligase